jgi:hypothetical protein
MRIVQLARLAVALLLAEGVAVAQTDLSGAAKLQQNVQTQNDLRATNATNTETFKDNVLRASTRIFRAFAQKAIKSGVQLENIASEERHPTESNLGIKIIETDSNGKFGIVELSTELSVLDREPAINVKYVGLVTLSIYYDSEHNFGDCEPSRSCTCRMSLGIGRGDDYTLPCSDFTDSAKNSQVDRKANEYLTGALIAGLKEARHN